MKNRKSFLLTALLLISLIGTLLTGCTSREVPKPKDNKIPDDEKETKELQDGRYIGSGSGFSGDLKLEILIKKVN